MDADCNSPDQRSAKALNESASRPGGARPPSPKRCGLNRTRCAVGIACKGRPPGELRNACFVMSAIRIRAVEPVADRGGKRPPRRHDHLRRRGVALARRVGRSDAPFNTDLDRNAVGWATCERLAPACAAPGAPDPSPRGSTSRVPGRSVNPQGAGDLVRVQTTCDSRPVKRLRSAPAPTAGATNVTTDGYQPPGSGLLSYG